MTILKTCKHHGPLGEEDIYREKRGPNKNIFLRCRKCAAEASHKRNTARSLKRRALLANDPTRRAHELKMNRVRNKRYWDKNRDKILKRRSPRLKKSVEAIDDKYIKGLLAIEGYGTYKAMPKDLVAVKKSILTIKRIKWKRHYEVHSRTPKE